MIHALAAHHGHAPVTTLEDLRRDVMGTHPWVHILVAPGLGYAALCPLVQLHFGVRGMDMHHLFVVDAARGTGVGRALIAASIEHAKGAGCRFMTVGTHPDNIAAQAVYRAVGFEDLPASGARFRLKW